MEVDTEAVLVDQAGQAVQIGQDADQEAYQQSHYIEVAQVAIFMEQNMSLGWFLVGWQYWKKGFGLIMSNFWDRFLHVFMGKKM